VSFCDAWETAVLDHVMNDGAMTPTDQYIGLSTTTPTDAGGNFTEPVGNGYARKATTGTDWDAAVAGSPSYKDNTATITFGTASGGSWGALTYCGFFDASSGGTPNATGQITNGPKTIEGGDTAQFAAGELDITLD